MFEIEFYIVDSLEVCIDCGDNFVDLGLRNAYASQRKAYHLSAANTSYNSG